jgi:tetrahydromethanopterin S-methyltransferase subunit A
MVWNLIPGKYEIGNEKSPVAVLTLNSDFQFDSQKVAIYGKVMTENLGITRILSNVLSNPNLRYLIICGREVGGHCPGDALISFYKNGYNTNEFGGITIKDTKAADPKLPIEEESIQEVHDRFRKQITLINMIGETNLEEILKQVDFCLEQNPEPMQEPYNIKLRKRETVKTSVEDSLSIHSKLRINYFQIHRR